MPTALCPPARVPRCALTRGPRLTETLSDSCSHLKLHSAVCGHRWRLLSSAEFRAKLCSQQSFHFNTCPRRLTQAAGMCDLWPQAGTPWGGGRCRSPSQCGRKAGRLVSGDAGASTEHSRVREKRSEEALQTGCFLSNGVSALSCPPPLLSPPQPVQSGQSVGACDLGGWEGLSIWASSLLRDGGGGCLRPSPAWATVFVT